MGLENWAPLEKTDVVEGGWPTFCVFLASQTPPEDPKSRWKVKRVVLLPPSH